MLASQYLDDETAARLLAIAVGYLRVRPLCRAHSHSHRGFSFYPIQHAVGHLGLPGVGASRPG
jgi:hypothetical protein